MIKFNEKEHLRTKVGEIHQKINFYKLQEDDSKYPAIIILEHKIHNLNKVLKKLNKRRK